MTIIETFKQLRDDIKTWVTNNLVALNEKVDSIESFSGDYDDLTNKPDILDDDSDSLNVADSSGNIIMTVNTNGINTTKIQAQTIVSNGQNITGDYNDLINKPNILEDGSGNLTISDSSGNAILSVDENGLNTTHVKAQSVILDGQTFTGDYEELTNKPNVLDDGSGSFIVADSSGNVVLEVDENGLNTTALSVNGVNIQSAFDSKVDKVDGKGLSTEDYTTADKAKLAGLDAALANKSDVGHTHDIDDALSDTSTNPDQNKVVKAETQNIRDIVSGHTDNTDIHITTTERTKWNNKSEFSGDYNDLTNAPNIREDESSNLVIADPSGNIIFRSNSDGFETTKLTTGTLVVNGADFGAIVSGHEELINGHSTLISNKVDKVTGKGLSTNDYTTAEKNKLAGIAEGANKTVVDTSLSETSTNPVQNKIVKAKFDELSDLIESKSDIGHTHDVATTSAAGLLSAEDKQKLDKLVLDGGELSVSGSVNAENVVGLSNLLAAKADVGHGHDVATTSADGFMSASDKSKLDGIATGATKVSVDSSMSSSSTNPVQNKVVNSAISKALSDAKAYTDTLIDGLTPEGTADAGVVQAALNAHIADKNNPHEVIPTLDANGVLVF